MIKYFVFRNRNLSLTLLMNWKSISLSVQNLKSQIKSQYFRFERLVSAQWRDSFIFQKCIIHWSDLNIHDPSYWSYPWCMLIYVADKDFLFCISRPENIKAELMVSLHSFVVSNIYIVFLMSFDGIFFIRSFLYKKISNINYVLKNVITMN